ncbi:unnamed protein product [Effrenium voratum]|nr:unnamed protein product [Effrenium voratum]
MVLAWPQMNAEPILAAGHVNMRPGLSWKRMCAAGASFRLASRDFSSAFRCPPDYMGSQCLKCTCVVSALSKPLFPEILLMFAGLAVYLPCRTYLRHKWLRATQVPGTYATILRDSSKLL